MGAILYKNNGYGYGSRTFTKSGLTGDTYIAMDIDPWVKSTSYIDYEVRYNSTGELVPVSAVVFVVSPLGGRYSINFATALTGPATARMVVRNL